MRKGMKGRVASTAKPHAMRARTHEFQVVVEQDEAGFFVAECPALRACYTQGRTYEEAIRNIRDVIGLCLDDLKARGAEIPRQAEIIGVKRIEVAA
jgi:predicted RNase H-like HicB family nuclease